jgi:hypothetical protein
MALTVLVRHLSYAALSGKLARTQCAGCGEWLGHEEGAQDIVCPLCGRAQRLCAAPEPPAAEAVHMPAELKRLLAEARARIACD